MTGDVTRDIWFALVFVMVAMTTAVSRPDSSHLSKCGGVSRILANVFVHEVLDAWFEHDVKPRLRGKGFSVQYADDAMAEFETERDARGVLAVLPKRFGKYGLRLHPEKAGLVPFQNPKGVPPRKDDPSKVGSFALRGFTHYWGPSRKGNWVTKPKTEQSHFGGARRAVAAWCRKNRHIPIKEQHEILDL